MLYDLIVSEIQEIRNNISAAYTAVSNKGGTLPTSRTLKNLVTAINSITIGGSGGAIKGNVTGDASGYTGWSENDYIELPYSFSSEEDWTFKIQVELANFASVEDLATTEYIWSLCSWGNGNDIIWESDGQGHMVPGFAVDYSAYIAGLKFGNEAWFSNYSTPWLEIIHSATDHTFTVKWWIQQGTSISWGPFDESEWGICDSPCIVGTGAGDQIPSNIKIMTVEYDSEPWTPEEWGGQTESTIEITTNGTYNVTDYTSALVNVSTGTATSSDWLTWYAFKDTTNKALIYTTLNPIPTPDVDFGITYQEISYVEVSLNSNIYEINIGKRGPSYQYNNFTTGEEFENHRKEYFFIIPNTLNQLPENENVILIPTRIVFSYYQMSYAGSNLQLRCDAYYYESTSGGGSTTTKTFESVEYAPELNMRFGISGSVSYNRRTTF